MPISQTNSLKFFNIRFALGSNNANASGSAGAVSGSTLDESCAFGACFVLTLLVDLFATGYSLQISTVKFKITRNHSG
jgi:hypothetical protein